MDSFNIVLLGENLPVNSIDLDDFNLLGRPMKELVRLPVLLEAQAGEFKLSVIPERFQVGAIGAKPTGDKLTATQSASLTFLEYAGRRTIRAVGHNFSVGVPGEVQEELLHPLVDYGQLKDLVGSENLPVVDLTVHFDTDGVSLGQVRILARGQEGSVKLDFNFHFDISKETISVEDAIGEFGDSLEQAREIAESVPAVIGIMETT